MQRQHETRYGRGPRSRSGTVELSRLPNALSRRALTLRSLVVFTLLARVAIAQAPDTAHPAQRATVSGVVFDSLSGQPLSGAVVQLVAAGDAAHSGQTAVSDSLGDFSFSDVPEGRYTIGFFHPLLDSLGVDAPVREVNVPGRDNVRADLSTPSPAQIRGAVCGSSDSAGVLVGVVRDAADGAPIPAATVKGEWLELSFTKAGVVNHVARLVATTGENGWFALCNVPAKGTISLVAAHGADSTDAINVEIPSTGFVRRELYVGVTPREVAGGTPVERDTSSSSLPRPARSGLSGTVVAAEGGKPISGAEVSVSGGFTTRSNERGEWSLPGLPPGTHMLDVRALGYSPDRRAIEGMIGAAPVRVALYTLKARLATVKVSANALHASDLAGFQERRRTGAGHYLTPADIERRGGTVASDVFRSMPGVMLGYPRDTLGDMVPADSVRTPLDRLILMRGVLGNWCAPAIYYNGVRIPGATADDVDTWTNAKDLAGIEVYTAASVPAQFQSAMTPCGSIVFWRK